MQFLAINFSFTQMKLLISTLQSVFDHVRRKEKYLLLVSTVLNLYENYDLILGWRKRLG